MAFAKSLYVVYEMCFFYWVFMFYIEELAYAIMSGFRRLDHLLWSM